MHGFSSIDSVKEILFDLLYQNEKAEHQQYISNFIRNMETHMYILNFKSETLFAELT